MFKCVAGRYGAADIERKYNPEYDIPPMVEVSWVEYALLQMVLELEERIAELEIVRDRDRAKKLMKGGMT